MSSPDQIHVGEREKETGVIIPENPADYLNDLFERTPDFIYTAADIPDNKEREEKQIAIERHRKRLQEALPKLPDLGKEYAQLLRTFCEQLGFDPGKIRAYLVGGRAYGKPLIETSDFDLILTVEKQGQGLQTSLSDSGEVAALKRKQYEKWSEKSFDIARKYNLTDGGDENETSLIETKGFGAETNDEFIVSNSNVPERRAVLIYSE